MACSVTKTVAATVPLGVEACLNRKTPAELLVCRYHKPQSPSCRSVMACGVWHSAFQGMRSLFANHTMATAPNGRAHSIPHDHNRSAGCALNSRRTVAATGAVCPTLLQTAVSQRDGMSRSRQHVVVICEPRYGDCTQWSRLASSFDQAFLDPARVYLRLDSRRYHSC